MDDRDSSLKKQRQSNNCGLQRQSSHAFDIRKKEEEIIASSNFLLPANLISMKMLLINQRFSVFCRKLIAFEGS